ncbi:unnamed protein product [Spodoptera littoralis]|uniref:Peptidoglycan-recognition protein n=1 Tax=Spodoptera littoralis TaxID=7109 RepID=A0A9P0I4C3_SPOLI|nr:unnamed protein product [Spodoptera littoralis]CAH1641147.1 unnamed protein product [Spodoptera littoralis]
MSYYYHIFLFTILKLTYGQETPYTLVSRVGWRARLATQTQPLKLPVQIVVVHNTATSPCLDQESCSSMMRKIQKHHMDFKGWWDIGYSFCIGGQGDVYEGRGWKYMGAHALRFNEYSVGIALIGSWTVELPTKEQLDTLKIIIDHGVQQGHIDPDYLLVGHRDIRDTHCPGDTLQAEISQWPHYYLNYNGTIQL